LLASASVSATCFRVSQPQNREPPAFGNPDRSLLAPASVRGTWLAKKERLKLWTNSKPQPINPLKTFCLGLLSGLCLHARYLSLGFKIQGLSRI